MIRLILIFLTGFLLSCAEKVSPDKGRDNYIYRLPSSDYKNHYMTCNVFADKTFQGYLYDSPRENCLLMEIDKAPKTLFENDSLFLQVYPFKITESGIDYGSSIPIYTLDKSNSQTLVESFILDSHIVTIELEKSSDSFFEEHQLEICDLEEEWEGLQLVIYERRSLWEQEPAPLRVSKFLKPPFLIHPEYFRDIKGNELAAHHPFSSYISQYNSEPAQYYELAEDICRPFNE